MANSSDSIGGQSGGEKMKSGDVKRIVSEALLRAESERDAYVNDVSSGDEELKRLVLRRLREIERRLEVLQTGGGVPSMTELSHESRPARALGRSDERIGAYRLLSKLGSGGFGDVYAAEQTKPVRRRVAIKVLKAGMDSKAVLARFAAERQALALMDHPNVAKILDAGQTDQGRPYFAMELLKGESITRYCDRHKPSIEERLRLFVPVCQAVQHAHQKGIIHRDLKPSNILVAFEEGVPTAKVIDFGIAKAMTGPLSEITVYTQQGQFMGTPTYMSPEQAEMGALDVDTRADVYSLGVVLYHMLTGVPPFDPNSLKDKGYAEIQRILREDEPPLPSSRVLEEPPVEDEGSRPSARPLRRRAVSRLLTSELDWIVRKAMAKDRTRRYDTAAEFAADIQRYLSNEPVLAGPPTLRYRAKKFARRNRVPLGVVAVVAVAMTGALVQSNVQRIRVEEAREALAAISEFQSEILTASNPRQMGARLSRGLRSRIELVNQDRGLAPSEIEAILTAFDSSMRDVNLVDVSREVIEENFLSPAVQALEQRFDGQPLVKASLLAVIGKAYREIGFNERAASLCETVVTLRRTALGSGHPDTLKAINCRGIARMAIGELEAAERDFRAALAGLEQALGEHHEDTLTAVTNLGALLIRKGQLDDAEHYARRAASGLRVHDSDPGLRVSALANLGAVLGQAGRLDESRLYYQEALDLGRETFGRTSEQVIGIQISLAFANQSHGDQRTAGQLFSNAYESIRESHGDDDPLSIDLGLMLASHYDSQDRSRQAESLYRQLYARSRRVNGTLHSTTLMAMDSLGKTLMKQQRWDEAESALYQAESMARQLYGEDAIVTATIAMLRASCLIELARYAEAETTLLEAWTSLADAKGAGHALTQKAVTGMVDLYDSWRKPEKRAQWQARLEPTKSAAPTLR